MAAPTTQQSGYAYAVYSGDPDVGGSVIGGGLNATLTQRTALSNATNRSTSRWKSTICGVRSWSVQCDGHYLVSSVQVCVNGDSNPANFLVGSASGVGGVAIKGMTNITAEVTAELRDSVSSTTGLDREIVPATRTLRMTITGEWYDFDLDITPTGGDEALEDMVDLVDGTSSTAKECTLTWSSAQKLYANFRTETFTLSPPHDNIITYTLVVEATGTVTAPTTTSADTGLADILADIFNTSGVQSNTLYLSSDVADETEWTGTAYPERVVLNFPFTGDSVVGYDITFQGSGALTKQGGDA